MFVQNLITLSAAYTYLLYLVQQFVRYRVNREKTLSNDAANNTVITTVDSKKMH